LFCELRPELQLTSSVIDAARFPAPSVEQSQDCAGCRYCTSIAGEHATSHANKAPKETMSGPPPAAKIPDGGKNEIHDKACMPAAAVAASPSHRGKAPEARIAAPAAPRKRRLGNVVTWKVKL
jgi:hypothetical protein